MKYLIRALAWLLHLLNTLTKLWLLDPNADLYRCHLKTEGRWNGDGIFDRAIETTLGSRNLPMCLDQVFSIESREELSRIIYNFYTITFSRLKGSRLSSKDGGYTSTSSQDKRQRTRHIQTIKNMMPEILVEHRIATTGWWRYFRGCRGWSLPLASSRILVVVSREETRKGSNECEEIQEKRQELEERQREIEQH
ncbi:hypothetical protein EDD18DRAFT_1107710 [Armillaria luteobubalina]|uniref:Uncharacterized protein n=1 Tax=Armillaria luteobubalina TaxID=153913 RepID=A0AA39Q1W5_9AGAR|nr:hypothetical protein EDD18DRAFT_1107710 [Armillaria luteobubalina]